MAEAFPMILQLIHLTLRRAVARRDVRALRNLLLSEGAPAFAAALQCCSARVRADALSLLPLGERPAVIRHLPPALRDDLRPLYRARPNYWLQGSELPGAHA